jgi:hypothetical protein
MLSWSEFSPTFVYKIFAINFIMTFPFFFYYLIYGTVGEHFAIKKAILSCQHLFPEPVDTKHAQLKHGSYGRTRLTLG